LKHGFLEPVYQEALAIELPARRIPFRREVEIPVRYKGPRLACPYHADFDCFEDIVVELKALSNIAGMEHAQVINYLRAAGFRRGCC
jgi:GxxExxY protein